MHMQEWLKLQTEKPVDTSADNAWSSCNSHTLKAGVSVRTTTWEIDWHYVLKLNIDVYATHRIAIGKGMHGKAWSRMLTVALSVIACLVRSGGCSQNTTG